MGKQVWKPGNMLYPLPAVMVSVADKNGEANIITVAWTGTVCSSPAMLYVSVRPERYSHHMIKETGEFVVNLTTEDLVRATDYCGVRSGKDVDKWKEMKLTRGKANELSYAPTIEECPVNIDDVINHHVFRQAVLIRQICNPGLCKGSRLMTVNEYIPFVLRIKTGQNFQKSSFADA